MVISAWVEVVVAEVGRGIIVMEVGGGREGSLECLIYIYIYILKIKNPPEKIHSFFQLHPVREGVREGKGGKGGREEFKNRFSRS